MIVENKNGLGQESVFEFKYVPEFSTRTEKGESEETGVKQPGIERRNLKTLIIAMVVLGGIGWFSAQIALRLLRSFGRFLLAWT